ncbi:sensor histidine kinase [Paenibacillus sp. GCM10027626]|uniref:cache domain-containing sensor histidine kinase n=1 Tax=Paenibacillus sp. GCM10027626 TaxID=3273411 RepID=UPI0036279AE0
MRLQLEKIIIRFTRKMNLRLKMLFLYGIIVLVPTVLLGIGAGYITLDNVRNNYMVTIEEAVRQTAQNIEFRKVSYDLLATRTANDGELISRLVRTYANMYEQWESIRYIDRSFLSTSKYLPGIIDFRIYHNNETLTQDGLLLWKPEEQRSLLGESEVSWYSRTFNAPDSMMWTHAVHEPRQLAITRKIMNAYGNISGIVYMLLDYRQVFGELLQQPFKGSGSLYILDRDRQIIASSNPRWIGGSLNDSDLNGLWGGTNDAYSEMTDGKLVIGKPIDSGWYVIALIQLNEMERQSEFFLYGIIGITALFLMLSTFLLMTVMKNVVWRIRKLGSRMNDISHGEFSVTVKKRDADELGELENHFNHMAGRLGKLVEDITAANLKEKEQSFKALQAQINPHFIYNSLSLIRWRAMDMKDETQIRTIDALTTFYRLALDNRVNVIRIGDEIEHVKAYLAIQEQRYPGRVRVEWNIDRSVLMYYTIKMFLQPIVENCYLHGNITSKKDALILISIIQAEDCVRFEICDNGKGIAPALLAQIREGNPIGKGNGFGMANIRERLLLYFGSSSSFMIDSVDTAWTRVTIEIPACLDKPSIQPNNRKEEQAC